MADSCFFVFLFSYIHIINKAVYISLHNRHIPSTLRRINVDATLFERCLSIISLENVRYCFRGQCRQVSNQPNSIDRQHRVYNNYSYWFAILT